MDKESVEQTLPFWRCRDLFDKKQKRTVGDVSTLVCRGDDPIEAGGDYKFKFEKKNTYLFKILSTTKDTKYEKSFEIVPYLAAKGDVQLVFLKDGVEVFTSVYQGLQTDTVLGGVKDPKPHPPEGVSYVLPSYVQIGILFLCALFIIFYFFMRTFQKIKIQAEFSRVVSKARYSDPFMDFNIEIRELIKEKKYSQLFLKRLDETFKKLFFRVFKENAYFDNKGRFIRNLKGLGVEPHEIRSIFVLEEDYKKFQDFYTSTQGKFVDQKKDFLDQAKFTINKIKRHANTGEL
jgi:hypothetical protein